MFLELLYNRLFVVEAVLSRIDRSISYLCKVNLSKLKDRNFNEKMFWQLTSSKLLLI